MTIKNIIFAVCLALVTLLTGCGVVLVGAVGAARVSGVDQASSEISHDESKIFSESPSVNLFHSDNKSVDDLTPHAVLPDEASLLASEQFLHKAYVDRIVEPERSSLANLPTKLVIDTTARNLTLHAWKIIGVKGLREFNFKPSDSVFLFDSNSEFKAFIACNYISGRFEVNDSGRFLLSKLNSSNNVCESSKDQEVLIESMLLSANKFFINEDVLILSSQGSPVLAFDVTNKFLNFYEFGKLSRHKMKIKRTNKATIKVKHSQKLKLLRVK